MIDKILVPLDGSTRAEAALPIATMLAERTHAKLILLRAAQYKALLSDVAGDQYGVIGDAEQYLRQLTERLQAQGFAVDSGVPFGASPADWILEESEHRQVDLVVMATHGREGLDRWLHGSVAEAVVQGSNVPVMLVRAGDRTIPADTPAAGWTQQPVLVVPLDGSKLAEAALTFAAELQQALGARVVLVNVQPKPARPVAGDSHLDADARAYLTAASARLEAAGATAEIVLLYGDAVSEISAAAEVYPASAVIMATHGRTGLARAMIGSVAGGVLHHTSAPVVLVRPSA